MKKLLLIAVMAFIGLVATDTFGRHYGRYYGSGYGKSCGTGGCEPCYEECPPPPCCEREQVITVREAPHKVCGWVCPDGTREIPTSEAKLVD